MTKLNEVIGSSNTAGRPAAGVAGRLWYTTDASPIGLYRDNGSAWVQVADEPGGGGGGATPMHLGLELTAPPTTGWSWVNQASSTIATIEGAEALNAQSGGSAQQLSLRVRTLPTAPFYLVALLVPTLQHADAGAVGICVRESSSGKITALQLQHNTEPALNVKTYTDETTWLGTVATDQPVPFGPIWLRIQRYTSFGGGWAYDYSYDGRLWFGGWSQTPTEHGTPNQIGFHANPVNVGVGVSVLSWVETAGEIS